MIPPAAASVTATPTDGPVNDTAPPTFKFFSIPAPPSTQRAPLSLLVEFSTEFTYNRSLTLEMIDIDI